MCKTLEKQKFLLKVLIKSSLSQYSQVNAQTTPNYYPFHATRPQQQIKTDREDETLYANLF